MPDGSGVSEHPLGWKPAVEGGAFRHDAFVARPVFTESDTYLAHVHGLCRFDAGQCDHVELHAMLQRRAAFGHYS